MLIKWDLHCFVPKIENRMSVETALEVQFKQLILDQVPPNRKIIWIKNVLSDEAAIVYLMPFVLRRGVPFSCNVMKAPRVFNNRSIQIEHMKNCSDCVELCATDFHPLEVYVDGNSIWKIVVYGLLELHETRNAPFPTFNNLPCLLDGKPHQQGKHLIIFGLGRSSRTEENFTESISNGAGFDQTRMTLLMRIITFNVINVYGAVEVSPDDILESGVVFLNLLKQDFAGPINMKLQKISKVLSRLLREVGRDLVDTEPESVLEFRRHFYGRRTYEFKYTELEGIANQTLDTTGLLMLDFIESLSNHGFKISILRILGMEFCRTFITRNLVQNGDMFQVREERDSSQPSYSKTFVGGGW